MKKWTVSTILLLFFQIGCGGGTIASDPTQDETASLEIERDAIWFCSHWTDFKMKHTELEDTIYEREYHRKTYTNCMLLMDKVMWIFFGPSAGAGAVSGGSASAFLSTSLPGLIVSALTAATAILAIEIMYDGLVMAEDMEEALYEGMVDGDIPEAFVDKFVTPYAQTIADQFDELREKLEKRSFLAIPSVVGSILNTLVELQAETPIFRLNPVSMVKKNIELIKFGFYIWGKVREENRAD